MADIRAIQIPARTNGSIQQLDSLIPQHLSSYVQRTSPHLEASGPRTRFLRRLKLRGNQSFGFLVGPERDLPRELKPRRRGTEDTKGSVGGLSAVWLTAEAFWVSLGGKMEGSIKVIGRPDFGWLLWRRAKVYWKALPCLLGPDLSVGEDAKDSSGIIRVYPGNALVNTCGMLFRTCRLTATQ